MARNLILDFVCVKRYFASVENPWVAWYPGDYINKTRGLTQGQHGAYLLLLWEYYINGPISARAEQVLNMCSAHDQHEKENVAFVLKEYFTLRNGSYHHKRADEEIAKRQDIRNKRVKAGKARQHMMSTQAAHAEHMVTQSQSHINPNGKGGDTVYSKSKKPPSQKDFDARDIRLMAVAEKRIGDRLKAGIGGQNEITEGQFFEAVCEEVGITVERGLELRKIQRSWPK